MNTNDDSPRSERNRGKTTPERKGEERSDNSKKTHEHDLKKEKQAVYSYIVS